MISRISKKLAIKIYKNDYKHLGDLEIYTYGLELILSSIFNMLIIIAFSACTGLAKEMFAFLIFFGILRISAGGYHASTHFMCLLQYTIISFGLIVMAKMIMGFSNLNSIIMVFNLLACVMVFKFAPVDSANKPLSDYEIIQFKRKSRLTVLAQILVLTILLYFNHDLIYYVLICSMGILGESITLIPILNKKGEMQYEKSN